jgi:hypothetical protein
VSLETQARGDGIKKKEKRKKISLRKCVIAPSGIRTAEIHA